MKQICESPSYFNVSGLPLELIHLICVFLCDHCSQDWLDQTQIRFQALVALSQTCLRLRSVAQRYLFHQPFYFKSLIAGNRRYSLRDDEMEYSILKTLISRPDLAACVQKLDIGIAGVFYSSSRISLLQPVARDLRLIGGSENLTLQESQDYGCYPTLFGRFTHELLIAMLPNLRTLVLSMGHACYCGNRSHDGQLVSNRFLAERLESLGDDGGSMPNLSMLQLYSREEDEPFHFRNPGISVLLRAAPNIETLVLFGIKGLGSSQLSVGDDEPKIPVLKNLRSLALQACDLVQEANIETEDFLYLRAFVRSAPNLERFRYCAAKRRPDTRISRPRLLLALESSQSTLKDIDFRFGYRRRRTSPHILALNLQKFHRLETFRLDEGALYPHWPFPEDSESSALDRQTARLVDVLPPRIRVLMIGLGNECSLLGDIVQVARSTAAGKFPRLRHVQLEYPGIFGRSTRATEVNLETLPMQPDLLPDYETICIAFLNASVRVWLRGTVNSTFDNRDAPNG